MEEKENAVTTVEERRLVEPDVEPPLPLSESEIHPMSLLMDEAFQFRTFNRGDIVEGRVVAVTPTDILVDIGAKSEGVITGREIERLGPEGLAKIKPDDKVLVCVVWPEDAEGRAVLSLSRAQLEKDWRSIEAMFRAGEVFETTVAGFNKGGLIIRMGKVRGFVPASQLVPPRRKASDPVPSRDEQWARRVGQPIKLKIVEMDRKRNRLILSERAALREWRKQRKDELLNEIQVGDVLTGQVSSLCDFGAFVDLGGADGLVHLSELSWKRISHPNEAVKVGDEVEVQVVSVDRDKKRIGLSLKRLQPEPWSTVKDRYFVGQLVEGQITKLANFGAFALIDGEIEGLIHVSELSDQHITHPKEVVRENERLTLRIIHIDSDRRRMALSLKQVNNPEYADLDWRAEYEAGLKAPPAEAETKAEEKPEAESWPEQEEFEVLAEEWESETGLETEPALVGEEGEKAS